MPQVPILIETGRTGLTRWGGNIHEEFLVALRGARGMRVYREMSSNDPVIGAILFAAKQLIRRATWRVEPQGNSNVDLAASEFLESCRTDMESTWEDFIAEVLSMIIFGWSLHEIVYKIRRGDVRDRRYKSKYTDNRIGWRKLPGRAQESLYEWKYDDNDTDMLLAMVQQAAPDYIIRTIPMEKALLFRTETNKGNPEGRSLLRNAYRPWYFKKRIEEIEGIGIERDLAGLPVLVPPEGLDIWNIKDPDAVRLKAVAESIVKNIRRDQSEGVVLPRGWELTLLSTGSKRQFDTSAIINRYDQRIAITVLADLVMLGADKVGSFALADVKKGMFAAALEAFLDSIQETLNRDAVEPLFKLNPFPGLTKVPRLIHGEVESVPLDQLGKYITALSGVNIDLTDPKTQNHLREQGDMPRLTEAEIEASNKKREDQQKQQRLLLTAGKGGDENNAGGNKGNPDETGDDNSKER